MSDSEWLQRRPEVVQAREFLEITHDFTNPKEVLREAISNAVDWGATRIDITITEDRTRPRFAYIEMSNSLN